MKEKKKLAQLILSRNSHILLNKTETGGLRNRWKHDVNLPHAETGTHLQSGEYQTMTNTAVWEIVNSGFHTEVESV